MNLTVINNLFLDLLLKRHLFLNRGAKFPFTRFMYLADFFLLLHCDDWSFRVQVCFCLLLMHELSQLLPLLMVFDDELLKELLLHFEILWLKPVRLKLAGDGLLAQDQRLHS